MHSTLNTNAVNFHIFPFFEEMLRKSNLTHLSVATILISYFFRLFCLNHFITAIFNRLIIISHLLCYNKDSIKYSVVASTEYGVVLIFVVKLKGVRHQKSRPATALSPLAIFRLMLLKVNIKLDR